jgi:linoleoyl-CoA desaturase
MSSQAVADPVVLPVDLPRSERLKSLQLALDDVGKRARARMGDEDVTRVRRLNRFSRAMEMVGRVTLHLSFEPISFGVGVGALWIHKQLQATEIGHPVLHGCYDRLEGAEKFQSKTWKWDMPIDEEAWHRGHNLRHHPYTNIAGKDPDIHFGPVRLNRHTPHKRVHYVQLPYTLFVMWPAFGIGMNSHFSGLLDITREERDFLPDRSWKSVKGAFVMAFRKYIPYFGKEYVFFPLLAGPMWWKVLAGNWMAETMRDIYSACSIFCGHVGPDLDGHPEGTHAHGRGEWYAMQIDQAQNFEVPYVLSVLCGGLDYQIEHHLYPKLPPERLREIGPEVRQICEDHGLKYRTGSWGRVLGRALKQVWDLSFPDPQPEVAHA